MAKIYISSTSQDLKAERQAVIQTLEHLGHQPWGMEFHNEAGEEKPVQRCLEEVRSCDIYLGIIAWRYGYVPENTTISITEMEYQTAGEKGIPRLIFILDPQTKSWPPMFVDDDKTQIKAFREHLQTEHYTAFFETANELAQAVNKTIQKSFPSQPISIPPLLPYKVNRFDQERAFAFNINSSTHKPRIKIICIHGIEGEAHNKLVERLSDLALPQIIKKSVHRKAIPLEPHHRHYENFAATYQYTLYQKLDALTLGHYNSPQILNDYLASTQTPLVLYSHLLAEDCEQSKMKAIDFFMHYWKNWPTLHIKQNLIVFLSIKYRNLAHSGWFSIRSHKRLNQKIYAHLEYIRDQQTSDSIDFILLPKLQAISRNECESWALDEDVQKATQAMNLIPHISDFYAENDGKDGVSGIQMETLAEYLTKLLENSATNKKGAF